MREIIDTTTTTKEISTTALPTTTMRPIKPVPKECGWTPWINTDQPDTGEDDGDVEDLAKIQVKF